MRQPAPCLGIELLPLMLQDPSDPEVGKFSNTPIKASVPHSAVFNFLPKRLCYSLNASSPLPSAYNSHFILGYACFPMPVWYLTPTTAKAGNISFCSQCNKADFKADPPFQSSYEIRVQKEATCNAVRESKDEQHKIVSAKDKREK